MNRISSKSFDNNSDVKIRKNRFTFPNFFANENVLSPQQFREMIEKSPL